MPAVGVNLAVKTRRSLESWVKLDKAPRGESGGTVRLPVVVVSVKEGEPQPVFHHGFSLNTKVTVMVSPAVK
ncbi:hypothetical protein D8B22_17560 [Verminephrobacter aporrectodeae subsp. tuberculatae]|nr:hypothetical protein [Verminephrobacter aporrectodeae subsp. tuberculatae]MCW8170869.1 hypothetical protein [Verminephrobacter aporrectodeae subsp. tuberculatae]